ncbi:MAG TPA: hypothetical protein VG186_10995 [Solirubrobacteraceae bacterium]|nr:hypothetical protein [Solirubrobacteraceae bacterium]
MSATAQSDRTLERITAHLRAHVTELRRLERAGAAKGELEERREIIARLRSYLAVRAAGSGRELVHC